MTRVYRLTAPRRVMVSADLDRVLAYAYLWHRYGWRLTLTSYLVGEDSPHHVTTSSR